MLKELEIKGGIDGLYDIGGASIRAQSRNGRSVMTNHEPQNIYDRSGDAQYQVILDPSDYISPNGYLPQKLVLRSLSLLKQASSVPVPPLRMMATEQNHFQIDKRLGQMTDEYFHHVVRPNQTLLDSEQLAL